MAVLILIMVFEPFKWNGLVIKFCQFYGHMTPQQHFYNRLFYKQQPAVILRITISRFMGGYNDYKIYHNHQFLICNKDCK